MTDVAIDAGSPKAPWHLWPVGVLALLWNAAGAYTIMTAQAGRLAGVAPDEAAYYAAQPTWFVVVTDVALIAAIAAAAALLLRSRLAVPLFGISLAAIAHVREPGRPDRDHRDLAAGRAAAALRHGDEEAGRAALGRRRPYLSTVRRTQSAAFQVSPLFSKRGLVERM